MSEGTNGGASQGSDAGEGGGRSGSRRKWVRGCAVGCIAAVVIVAGAGALGYRFVKGRVLDARGRASAGAEAGGAGEGWRAPILGEDLDEQTMKRMADFLAKTTDALGAPDEPVNAEPPPGFPGAQEWVIYDLEMVQQVGPRDKPQEEWRPLVAVRPFPSAEKKLIIEKLRDPDGKTTRIMEFDVNHTVGKMVARVWTARGDGYYDGGLMLKDLVTGESRWLDRERSMRDRPAFSHDGQAVAYHVRTPSELRMDTNPDGDPEVRLFVCDLEKGSTRELTAGITRATSPVWSMDDRFIYSVDWRKRLMRVDQASGETKVFEHIDRLRHVLGANDTHLAYVTEYGEERALGALSCNVWKCRLDGTEAKFLRAFGNILDVLPSYDGKYVYVLDYGYQTFSGQCVLNIETEEWFTFYKVGVDVHFLHPLAWVPATAVTWPEEAAEEEGPLPWSVASVGGKDVRVPEGFTVKEGTTPEPYAKTGWAHEVVHGKTGIEMVFIPAGEFEMGGAWPSLDGPVHTVRITRPFYMAAYEVTQGQWAAVMGGDPADSGDKRHPVEWTTYHDIERFLEGAGGGLRLPTEAEWEYACRAGTTTKFSFGDDWRDADRYAWHSGNSGSETHPVGEKLPNAWGLHDVHGNVQEFCADWYDEKYYGRSPKEDPRGPSAGSFRAVRGGSAIFGARQCSSAVRGWYSPSDRAVQTGFRVCRSVGGRQRGLERVGGPGEGD